MVADEYDSSHDPELTLSFVCFSWEASDAEHTEDLHLH